MKTMRSLGVMILAGALLPQIGAAGETGYAVKPVELKADPSSGAQTIAPLAKDARFEILNTDGGWTQVSMGKVQGWLRMFYVAIGQPRDQVAVGKEVGNAVGLATGRQGSGQVVSVIGIRGINEEQLKGARFNAERLRAAEAFLVTKPEAAGFANEARLAPRSVDYLPNPNQDNPAGGRDMPSGG